MAKHDLAPRILRMLMALVCLGAAQCNHAQCEDLRDKLTDLKRTWQSCQTDADCIIVGGNAKDCTGILSCNFAVNRRSRNEAERIVASLPEETLDCIECTSPSCIGGTNAYCDTTTSGCSMVVVAPAPTAPAADAAKTGGTNADATEGAALTDGSRHE